MVLYIAGFSVGWDPSTLNKTYVIITIGNVLNIFTTEGGPVESTEDS